MTKSSSSPPFLPITPPCRAPPALKQIADYDVEMINTVRNSNLTKLVDLYNMGRNMNACNKFSESIVHMSCRRAKYDVVEFLLSHGGDASIVDDYGRTPLHDACWRLEPAFDIVTLILDKNNELLRCSDARGAIPLRYVPQAHWAQWCVYLYHQREKYWPILPSH